MNEKQLQSIIVKDDEQYAMRYSNQQVDKLRLEIPKWMEITDEVLRNLQKRVKSVNRECQCVEIILANNQKDEAGISGEELTSLLDSLRQRIKVFKSLKLDLEHWSLLFAVIPNIQDQLTQICSSSNLNELILVSNNKSLNASVSNKAIRSLGQILYHSKSLIQLELQLDDSSPQKHKQINEDGFIEFSKGLAQLSQLKDLHLSLSYWFSFNRHRIKQLDHSISLFSSALSSNKKQLQKLTLCFGYWEDVEFKHLKQICDSLVSNQVAQNLKYCHLDFIRWSYFNQQNEMAAVYSLEQFLSKLVKCNDLFLSFFQLGTGFQDQRDLRNHNMNDGNNNQVEPQQQQAYMYRQDEIQASPNLLKLFMQQIAKQKSIRSLEIQIHEYVSWNGMKVLRNNFSILPNLTTLKISTRSEDYEYKKYLNTLLNLPKMKRRLILFFRAIKQIKSVSLLYRKDFIVYLAYFAFNLK